MSRIKINPHCNVVTGDDSWWHDKHPQVTVPDYRMRLNIAQARELGEAMIAAADHAALLATEGRPYTVIGHYEDTGETKAERITAPNAHDAMFLFSMARFESDCTVIGALDATGGFTAPSEDSGKSADACDLYQCRAMVHWTVDGGEEQSVSLYDWMQQNGDDLVAIDGLELMEQGETVTMDAGRITAWMPCWTERKPRETGETLSAI